MCKNKYNLTGLCCEKDCPLAHGRYATVLEEDGVCYLYMKTVERAHTPANLWERVQLSKNFIEAVKQIDEHLMYWPDYIQNRSKVRLMKLRQVLMRMRKLRNKVQKEYVPVNQKERRRDDARQEKAEMAAQVEKKIKMELLERLKRGVYDDANLQQKFFDEALKEAELASDEEVDIYEDEEEDDEELSNQLEKVERYIEDFDGEDRDVEDFEIEDEDGQNGDQDAEEVSSKRKGQGKGSNSKRAKRVIEYEENDNITTNFQTE